eukprot:CAMPEP_0177620804 /NCGR_PEP_ID=MMETSP0419_2-20121207/27151_1 /TAXON_ID=582737 /ORGANISM="Tetraselmis sp., Strain GSL018" /LENGTH=188 /DNA_ID=CAMNT_0019120487 /DNA_START=301 /DNA_END=865 /DNA_ORIENTATION=+
MSSAAANHASLKENISNDRFSTPTDTPDIVPCGNFTAVISRHCDLKSVAWRELSLVSETSRTVPSNLVLGLDISGNLCKTLDGLECYPWLRAQNDLRSLGAPRLPFTLTHIDVSHNVLKSLEGLQELPYLTWLDAGHNYLEGVEPLRGCYRMRELRLGNNNVSSLEGLEGLLDLSLLELHSNQVSRTS